jgi:hypothetical protein
MRHPPQNVNYNVYETEFQFGKSARWSSPCETARGPEIPTGRGWAAGCSAHFHIDIEILKSVLAAMLHETRTRPWHTRDLRHRFGNEPPECPYDRNRYPADLKRAALDQDRFGALPLSGQFFDPNFEGGVLGFKSGDLRLQFANFVFLRHELGVEDPEFFVRYKQRAQTSAGSIDQRLDAFGAVRDKTAPQRVFAVIRFIGRA